VWGLGAFRDIALLIFGEWVESCLDSAGYLKWGLGHWVGWESGLGAWAVGLGLARLPQNSLCRATLLVVFPPIGV
jgi:hypothetical protein